MRAQFYKNAYEEIKSRDGNIDLNENKVNFLIAKEAIEKDPHSITSKMLLTYIVDEFPHNYSEKIITNLFCAI